MNDDSKKIEIVLGNKNVAEAGSQQINITQNNFDPEKLKAALQGLRDEGKRKPGRKKKAPRIVMDTYKYQWIDCQEGQMRLIRLYQLLIDERFHLLSPEVKPDEWCALFMGQAKPFTMKWIGKQAHLRYLFKLLINRKYLTYDKKSAGKWEILGSHFVGSDGRPFKDWDSQYDPKKGSKTLQMFADVLNIASDMPNTESDEDAIYEEMEAFSNYENEHPRHDYREDY